MKKCLTSLNVGRMVETFETAYFYHKGVFYKIFIYDEKLLFVNEQKLVISCLF